MTDFANETALTPGDEGRWTGHVSPHWNIGDNPNGGYLVAIAMQAVRQLSPQHPDPLSITVHYQRPGVPDEQCEVVAECLRRGRTLSTVRATLMQSGKARIEVLAALGDLGTSGADTKGLTIQAPDIPPPDQCIERSGDEQGLELPILDRLDIRLHPKEAKAASAGKAQVSGWIRFKDGHPADSLATILFADAYPPSVFGLLGVVGWVPTIELTVHVRRRPAPGWVLGQFRTSDLAQGRMIEDGLLWDENGDLIAQSRQIALLLPRQRGQI